MRIISGHFRGRVLAPFAGTHIRPTPDRVREALFSMLGSRCGSFHGLKVLDLYAGSGAQGLEALSRGAASVVMVEKDSAAIKLIQDNLARCRCSVSVTLLQQDVLRALPDLAGRAAPYDLIFLDPPYRQGLAEATLVGIERLNLLDGRGIICAETDRREVLDDSYGTLKLVDSRTYGTTGVHLFQMK